MQGEILRPTRRTRDDSAAGGDDGQTPRGAKACRARFSAQFILSAANGLRMTAEGPRMTAKRSAETRCVSHFDSPSRHCHPESRFFRDEGSAFVLVTENPCRSFAAAQDDSLGDCFSSASFCSAWAAERLSTLRMTVKGRVRLAR